MMDRIFLINISLAILVAAMGIVGLLGDGWDAKKPKLLTRITIWGWVMIVLTIVTLVLLGVKELHESEGREETEKQEIIAIISIASELSFVHAGFRETIKDPRLRNPEFAGELELMRAELEKKVDRHRNQLRSETIFAAEISLTAQKIAILELSKKNFSMAQAVQYIMEALIKTDEFAKKIIEDGRMHEMNIQATYESIIGYELK